MSRVEEVLSSKGRVRILKILSEVSELNISEIVRRAQLNYSTASKHLAVLERAGLVREKRFGKIRIFSFVDSDPRAKAVKALIRLWEQDARA